MYSLWNSIRIAVNKYEDGKVITRKNILKEIEVIHGGKFSQSSFDIYRLLITNVGVLGKVKNGKKVVIGSYRKLQNFPEIMTSAIAHKLESEMKWGKTSWKDWFAKDLTDRIRLIEKK